MVKFREIIRLHELGYNQSEIARSCVVARSTVQDYLRRASAKGLSYEQLQKMSDSQAQTLLGKQKTASVTAKAIEFELVHQELAHKGVTLALLWQEGIDRGDWQLSYGQFCRRYNQALPYWIGSHQRALNFLGGVPACIVPDNLKSGITDPCRYEPGVNRSYQDLAAHYQVAVIPARPQAPKDKAKVEKAVQEVERQILAPLRHQQFSSFSELNEAIRPLLKRLNERVMSDYGLSRLSLFERVDRPALKPLPKYPFVFASWKRAKVNLDYHIEVEKHYYSVPYWYVRREVNVKVSEQVVEIFYEHQRIAIHPRSSVPYRHSTLPEHMPPEHWAYKSQSKQNFLAWANRIGPHTTTQTETIFASKPHEEQSFRTLKGLQSLAAHYGAERLEAACHRANTFGIIGYRRLKAILQHHLDRTPILIEAPASPAIAHDNLRGAAYYN